MLLGKMLRGLTGTPMRRMALANSSLAEAEPEPVDVGELDDEVVDGFDAVHATASLGTACLGEGLSRQLGPAWVVFSRNFCMSQAPVGQRSAQRPQCRQTSSSFTITRPVFSPPATYRSWVRLSAGALSLVLRSGSSALPVKVMQSIGQMSTQASHSMHSLSVNTVCTSQLRQRWASFHAVATSKPSSTSIFTFFSVALMSAQGTL